MCLEEGVCCHPRFFLAPLLRGPAALLTSRYGFQASGLPKWTGLEGKSVGSGLFSSFLLKGVTDFSRAIYLGKISKIFPVAFPQPVNEGFKCGGKMTRTAFGVSATVAATPENRPFCLKKRESSIARINLCKPLNLSFVQIDHSTVIQAFPNQATYPTSICF